MKEMDTPSVQSAFLTHQENTGGQQTEAIFVVLLANILHAHLPVGLQEVMLKFFLVRFVTLKNKTILFLQLLPRVMCVCGKIHEDSFYRAINTFRVMIAVHTPFGFLKLVKQRPC
jgi:hypothetical protein